MQYNECPTCGAKDGRCGNKIHAPNVNAEAECFNCYDTRKTGTITIHAHLSRTDEELQKTFSILDK